jgi:hypothetical protein
VALAAASVLRRLLPMPRWAWLVGRPGVAPAEVRPQAPRPGRDRDVALALRSADRRLPWPTTCLDRAVAGQLLLRRRGRPGTLVIGLDRADVTAVPHAWLMAGDAVLVGGEVMGGYVPTTAFTVTG